MKRTPGEVEDATATLLNLILKHLEGSNTHAKILFVDFSSAFNTIQPHILVDKLLRNFYLDFSLVGWILDFFNGQNLASEGEWGTLRRDTVLYRITTGLCPVPSFIHPIHWWLSQPAHKQTYFKMCRWLSYCQSFKWKIIWAWSCLNYFIAWCDSAHLHLNVSKTNDMVIDYRRKPPPTQVTSINGQPVEVVASYKYLGSIILILTQRIYVRKANSVPSASVKWQNSMWIKPLWDYFINHTLNLFYPIPALYNMLVWKSECQG